MMNVVLKIRNRHTNFINLTQNRVLKLLDCRIKLVPGTDLELSRLRTDLRSGNCLERFRTPIGYESIWYGVRGHLSEFETMGKTLTNLKLIGFY